MDHVTRSEVTLDLLAWPSLVKACTAKTEDVTSCAALTYEAAERLCQRLFCMLSARFGACLRRAALLARDSRRGNESASPRLPEARCSICDGCLTW